MCINLNNIADLKNIHHIEYPTLNNKRTFLECKLFNNEMNFLKNKKKQKKNNKIELCWLNKTIDSFKIHCELTFLSKCSVQYDL